MYSMWFCVFIFDLLFLCSVFISINIIIILYHVWWPISKHISFKIVFEHALIVIILCSEIQFFKPILILIISCWFILFWFHNFNFCLSFLFCNWKKIFLIYQTLALKMYYNFENKSSFYEFKILCQKNNNKKSTYTYTFNFGLKRIWLPNHSVSFKMSFIYPV